MTLGTNKATSQPIYYWNPSSIMGGGVTPAPELTEGWPKRMGDWGGRWQKQSLSSWLSILPCIMSCSDLLVTWRIFKSPASAAWNNINLQTLTHWPLEDVAVTVFTKNFCRSDHFDWIIRYFEQFIRHFSLSIHENFSDDQTICLMILNKSSGILQNQWAMFDFFWSFSWTLQ